MRKIFYCIIVFFSLVVSAESQTCGSTDIGFTKTVTVSSEVQWHERAAAVDHNPQTWWQSTSASGDAAYLYVDLLQSYNVCRVLINWGNNGKAANYTIDISTDSTNWTQIKPISGNAANSNDNIITVNNTGRYLRINMTLRYYNWASYEIYDLEIYNSLAGNTPPTTNITSPTTNTQLQDGSNLTISANAADVDGSITKVEFYNGSTKLSEDPTAPYSYEWPNLLAGTYTLTSKAYDNDNASTTSSAISITVNGSSFWSLGGNASTGSSFIGTTNIQPLVFRINSQDKMTILETGLVRIGSSISPAATDQQAKLAVAGTIYAKKLRITQSGWADYVFEKNYKLMSLQQLELFISKNKRLPGIPSAFAVQNKGIDVGETQTLLLAKIEELTLYILKQNKRLEHLEGIIKELGKK